MREEKWLSNYAATKDQRDVQFLLERKLIDSIDAEGILRKNKVLEVFDGFKVFSKDAIKQFQGDSDTQVDLDEIGSKLEDDNVTVEEVWLMKKDKESAKMMRKQCSGFTRQQSKGMLMHNIIWA